MKYTQRREARRQAQKKISRLCWRRPVTRRDLTGDDPGDVGAVTVGVGEWRRRAGEVEVGDRFLDVEVRPAREVGVGGVDAGIDHGPDDALAGGRKGHLRGIGLDGADGLGGLRNHIEIGPDPVDGAARRRNAVQSG